MTSEEIAKHLLGEKPIGVNTHGKAWLLTAIAAAIDAAVADERDALAQYFGTSSAEHDRAHVLFSGASVATLIRSRTPAPERPCGACADAGRPGVPECREHKHNIYQKRQNASPFTTDVAKCPSHESPDKRCPWCHMRWLSEQVTKPAPVDPVREAALKVCACNSDDNLDALADALGVPRGNW